MIKLHEQNDVLRDVAERFERLGIAYMLTGSMALVRYAMPRMTADIDVVIEVSQNDAKKIIDEFEPDYYVPHGRVRDAILHNKMFNLVNQNTLIKIDCIIRKDDEFQRNVFARREKVDYANFEVWIISREDLILSKLNWAKVSRSEMQIRDAANILRNGYDEDYIKLWSEKLEIESLLEEALEKLKENAE